MVFVDVPRLPSPGMPAPDGWDWFGYSLLDITPEARLNAAPELRALAYLVSSLFLRVTYKIVPYGSTSLLWLRVYHTLADFDGCSILAKLRPVSKSINTNRIRHLRCLFSTMNFSQQAWNGDLRQGTCVIAMFSPRKETFNDNIDLFLDSNASGTKNTGNLHDNAKSRLLQIYRSLNSPVYTKENLDPETEYLIGLIETGSTPGIKTQLYKYQTQSVCKMLQVEMNPELGQLPNITSITLAVNNKKYYINSTDYTFFAHPSVYAAPRGGILAEDMGLGKSLICIALIAATKSQCSCRPEDEYEEEAEKKTARERKCTSLASYCVESVMKNNISWRMYADRLPRTCVNKLSESPGYYHTRPKFLNRALKHAEVTQLAFNARASARQIKSRYSTDLEHPKIWLSCSTLVICPSTLFDQWRYEIMKHIDPASVSTLCLSNSKFKTPTSMELLNYDIVLMSVPRFSLEESDKDSPLKFVHWKRLIIDEGHSMGRVKSKLSYLASELHAERRWAVSGTPTPGLTRMSVETSDELNNIAIQFSEKQELERLGSIMENFLMVEPWTTHKGMWHREIVKPFINNLPNSNIRVKRVLEQLVVRHKELDVTTDVILPPLHTKTVFLEPSIHNKLAINLFVSVINVNAVTSEREDQDYLFNPLNRGDLKRLMKNMEIASFYWSGFSEKDVQSLYDIAKMYLKKMDDVKSGLGLDEERLAAIVGTSKRLITMSDEERMQDEKLLKEAMETVDFVRHQKQWVSVSKSHEMCYYADNLPTAIYMKVAKTKDPVVWNQIYNSEQSKKILVASGSLLVDYKQQMGFYDRDPELTARLKPGSSDGQENAETFVAMPDPRTPLSKSPNSKGKPSTLRKNASKKKKDHLNTSYTPESGLTGLISTLSKFSDELQTNGTRSPSLIPTPSRSQSPFTSVNECDPEICKLLGTASAKLSYLVSKLIALTPLEKCIVFYEHDDIAFYIAEALDIVGIRYLIYANSVSPIQRSRYLAEFHVNDEFRVLLMNVRLASHGLDVSSASRVFFVNPIWRVDVEAQAIKRAHRIGQRRPVYVETLVLRGSMEEAAINRRFQQRHAQGNENENEEHELSENETIRQFLAAHPYLELSNDVNQSSSSEVAEWSTEYHQSLPEVFPFRKVGTVPNTINTSANSTTTSTESMTLHRSTLRTVISAASKRTTLRHGIEEPGSKRVKFAEDT